ncbi:hypothetical protein Dacet_2351 [Denitrovibrio acetiphilus DSM 12809]|uniref:Lipoprotein n=1 Tax=Denitrovibrio acetiphilus (strain DSM 12809 / NBRC 114555 / N2460) TaxID=522772 RepID=D4H3L1_DENA2|nr:hypothetical protein [Denitrovibrio acetiphilus]ADD69113.1 hypothetical protein Dacet_2351 [Denitrovibrio acetiphilus DSM 12809]
MKKILILITIVSAIFIAGCAPSAVNYTNISSMDLPVKKYPSRENLSDLSLAIAKPEVTISFKASNSLKLALRKRIAQDAYILACHLTQEMRKILVAKGFTITDTFDNLNAMTFTQKRNTSALFTAFISIEINEETLSDLVDYVPQLAHGVISSKAKLQIATIEPLSGEIVWLKNVPVQDSDIQLQYPYWASMNASETQIPVELSGTVNSIDDIFKQTNEKITQAVDSFVSVDEFMFLNTDIKKLKKIKRY